MRKVRAPYAERLNARRELLRRGLRRIVEICGHIEDVRAVFVFGSVARGDVRLRSDLDVLIVRDTTLRTLERDLDTRRDFDVPICLDLIVVTPNEFRTQLPASSFGRTILAEARSADAA